MKTVLFTASTGGVGVTTVLGATAAALARRGERTLILELGNAPALDLYFGAQSVLFDVTDLAKGALAEEVALSPLADLPLYFIRGAFPLAGAKLKWTPQSLSDLILRVGEEFKPDFLLLDAPATPGLCRILAPLADECIAVTAPTALSLRSQAALGTFLAAAGAKSIHQIVNGVDEGAPPPWCEVIDRVSLPLLGAFLLSPSLAEETEKGHLHVLEGNDSIAAKNVAARLLGEEVPLFWGMAGISRKRLIRI